MTGKSKKRRPLHPRGRDYEVGYGKPPMHSQFRKGQSGNPKGRPKGARTRAPDLDQLASIIEEEAYREVPLREGEREVRVPMVKAVVRALLVKGARGTARSAQVALELLRQIEDRKRKEHEEFVETVIAYKTEWDAEIAARKRRGEPEPDLDIHPDQIDLNVATGEVTISGPLTQKDREIRDELIKERVAIKAEVEGLRRRLKRARKPENRELIEEDIARCETKLEIIRAALPD